MLAEHEQSRISGLKACRQFFHESVVDAVVGQRSAECTGRRAQGNTDNWIEKDETYKEAPEAAGGGTYRCRVDQLIKFDRSGLRLDRYDGVADLDQILFLQLNELLPYLLCF